MAPGIPDFHVILCESVGARIVTAQGEETMKKFLAVALTAAIASTLSFAQTPVYNHGTRSAFTSPRLTEVKHRRKHKKHKHRKQSAALIGVSSVA